jgi:hypothetical protein
MNIYQPYPMLGMVKVTIASIKSVYVISMIRNMTILTINAMVRMVVDENEINF